jgi:tetratricopeptide (TPR) repeat protein
LYPANAAYYSNLGTSLQAAGRLDEAVSVYRRAIQLNPLLAGAHNNLGNALKTLGALDEAIGSYQRAIELAADFAEAYNNLGTAWKEQGCLGMARHVARASGVRRLPAVDRVF